MIYAVLPAVFAKGLGKVTVTKPNMTDTILVDGLHYVLSTKEGLIDWSAESFFLGWTCVCWLL